MLFLLAARPYMLPPPASRNSYARACSDLIKAASRSPSPSYVASVEDLVRAVALEPPDSTRDYRRFEQVSEGVYNHSVTASAGA
jgi:hypothetical protein